MLWLVAPSLDIQALLLATLLSWQWIVIFIFKLYLILHINIIKTQRR